MKQNAFKIERKRLSDQIIERVITLIASGELKPGDKLPPEPQLMDQFGVGRSSIREAFGALELIGLVRISPGHGTFIADSLGKTQPKSMGLSLITIGQDKIRELVEARQELEEAIVKLAAERATEADIAELKLQQAKLRTGLQEGLKNGRKLIEIDLGFHAALSKAGNNSVLARFLAELRQPMRNWMEQMAKYDWDFEQVLDEHQAVLDAIEARNPEGARSAMRAHVQIAGRKLVAALSKEKSIKERT